MCAGNRRERSIEEIKFFAVARKRERVRERNEDAMIGMARKKKIREIPRAIAIERATIMYVSFTLIKGIGFFFFLFFPFTRLAYLLNSFIYFIAL